MPAMNPDLSKLLAAVNSILTSDNCRAYLVGGFVRDFLLERVTHDIDIAVDRDAVEAAKKVANNISGRYVLLDEINKVARVVITGAVQPVYLDFSTFYGNIEDNLARRDFTINAMAVGLPSFISGSLQLIDPFNGKTGLDEKVIRAVTQAIFKDDPARLLRAFRLAAELGFKIERDTEHLIKRYAKRIALVPGEKQREELLKIFLLNSCSDFLRYLDEANLLTQVIPELEELRGVAQPKEHYWDVLGHSLETVACVEFVLRERSWGYVNNNLLEMVPWSEEIKRYFQEKVSGDSNRCVLLKIGGLLHDIAKPQTKTVDDEGRTRFIGHTKLGAAKAVDILTRLRFSHREIKLVENLVYYHLRPVQITNGGLPTDRAIYRYFRDTGDAGIDVLFLVLADYLAARGPNLEVDEWRRHNRLVSYMIAEYQEQRQTRLPEKLIDGNDLMLIFGLTSGPLLGKLLRLVRESQAVGEIKTRDEAINLVRRELKQKNGQ